MSWLPAAAVPAVFLLALVGTNPVAEAAEPASDTHASVEELTIPYERFELDNGLTVVLHQDRSDPIVAVATLVHVGSSREEPGRTGFAHFFEHMSFNDSENVPRGANRKRIEELGGSRNGGTNRDHTIYYEVVPSDSLEKILWIDSDRLGYMINTVTKGALENEKQVVKNEKRQRVDNAPYGFTGSVVDRNLYPEGHPYSWSVIGSLEDLSAATLDDVRTFYDRYYGPNNTTLVLAGDFEIEPTRKLIEAYFGEIPRGPEVDTPEPMPTELSETRSLMHLDAFAQLPELRLTFPTVERFHEDGYALDALAEILTEGKRAKLYDELVTKREIAQSVSAYDSSGELAGAFTIGIRAKAGVDLDEVLDGVNAALERFAEEGFEDRDLQRIKARQEREFYSGIQGVLDKAFGLAFYQVYAGDPAFVTTDLKNTLDVSRADIERVFSEYIQDQPHVMTSFVPKDAPKLAVEGAETAAVVEEQVVKGAEAPPAEVVGGDYEKTPTKMDRSSEPPLGEPSDVGPPEIHFERRPDGMGLYHLAQTELPLARFSILIEGGHRTEDLTKSGMTSLLGEWLEEGTENRTPEELEDVIGQLGAALSISSGRDSLVLSGSCLAHQFDEVFDLAVEMLTEPRFDAAELDRLKSERLTSLTAREGSARSMASLALNRALYGEAHPYGWPTDGVVSTVEPLGDKDLKKRWKKLFSTTVTDVTVVGDVDLTTAQAAAGRLASGLRSKPVKEVGVPVIPAAGEPELVFIDIPGSKQSVVYAGSVAMARGDEAWFDLEIARQRLGGGSSAQLFQTLRIDKGYTYGAYAFASERVLPGPFGLFTSVRANVTRESLQIAHDLVDTYGEGFDEDDLEISRTMLGKGGLVEFETLDRRLAHLRDLATYDLPPNTLAQQRARLEEVSVDDVKATVDQWMSTDQLTWVVVGDGETQREEVEVLGLPVIDWSAEDVNRGAVNLP